MSKAVNILVLRVGQPPVVENLPADVEGDGHLKAMQAIVGGFIECIRDFDGRGADLWCNEEGLIHELPINRVIPAGPHSQWHIHGDFFIARATDEGDLADLTPEDIAHYNDYFNVIDARARHADLVDALNHRGDYIAKNECLPAPFGCGGTAGIFRDDLSLREYKITAQCQSCQDRIYAEIAELEVEPLDEKGNPLS